MAYTTEILIWQFYKIEVKYDPGPFSQSSHNGVAIGHLEIRTVTPERAVLPITETGYRSVFMPDCYLDDYETAGDYVTQWLDSAALTKEWEDILDDARQLSLF